MTKGWEGRCSRTPWKENQSDFPDVLGRVRFSIAGKLDGVRPKSRKFMTLCIRAGPDLMSDRSRVLGEGFF